MPRPLRATGTRTPQLLSKPKSQGGRWGRRGGQVPCVPPRVPEDYGREPMAQIPVGSVEEVGKSAGPHLAGAEATGRWKIERARARQGAPGCAGAGVGREAAVLLLRGAPRRERRGDATPHLQAVWPPSGYLTPPCARMLPKAVLNIILLWMSSRLSSHLLRLITPPGSWSPKPGSGSPFHPPPALALGPGAAQPLLFIPNPSFRDF